MNIQEGYDATGFVGPINKEMNYLEGNNKSNKTATLWKTPVNPIKHGGHLCLRNVLFFVVREQGAILKEF